MSSCEVSLSSSDHLAGDTLRATITFRGHGDTVEWAAVQVHGHCWHDQRLVTSVVGGVPQPLVATPKFLHPRRSSSASSALGEKKTAMPDMSTWIEGTMCLFTSKPHCMAAELVLTGNHSFAVQASLPPVLPPSFRGVSTKYMYLFTVCVKLRSEESARVAHVPFFVAGTPGSLGDAARPGLPSPAFMEYLGGKVPSSSGKKKPAPPPPELEVAEDEEEELVMLHTAMLENGLPVDLEFVNAFPQRYDGWDLGVTSSAHDSAGKLWFLERDEGDEDGNDLAPWNLTSPRISDSHGHNGHHHQGQSQDGGAFHTGDVSVRAMNAQTGKGRLARCYVHPSVVNPGDAVTVRLDFAQTAERTLKIQATIEVEERTMGPPPLVAVLEPLLRKRQGSGPWLKALGSKTVDVSLCSSCAFSLSTYGAPPDFSTDLIVVHTYLRIEFTTESMVCNLRVPLNVRPPHRSMRVVNLSDATAISRMSSPKSPLPSMPSTGSANRLEEQSPAPTPSKRLVF